MNRRAIIIWVLFLVLLVAMLSWVQQMPADAKTPKGKLGVSVDPRGAAAVNGPVYLTSNLPVSRRSDDTLPLVTEGLPSLGGADCND